MKFDRNCSPARLIEKPEYFATFARNPDRRTETEEATTSDLRFHVLENVSNA